MRPTFLTRLVNGPLFDPIVYIRILNERKAIMFDCGSFLTISNRELMLLEAIFISHTHMDHFMGIDHVLRVIIHRENPLHIYGPEGIREKMLAKLHAYTWNLTQAYGLEIHIHEVSYQGISTITTKANAGFDVISEQSEPWHSHAIANTPRYSVEAVILDHNIPCLGFVIKEAFHINIRGDVLAERGYKAGPWLGRLKELIHAGLKGVIRVDTVRGTRSIPCEELVDDLVVVSPGQKITYLTDIRYSQANIERVLPLALGTDILFIEAFYLDEMRDEAYHKGHLTAFQAGKMALALNAKRVIPMHISPRHHDQIEDVLAEVKELISSPE